jgi:ABC-type bacteriocin/lantibiotic exporter with double-glycine peptidase domain
MATARCRSCRLLAPEVVQTSAMDCGPAALKCLLEGFGIPVSYGRLREACQTDVDGTSIDTLEEIAIQLGLDAEQIMVPVDHLLLSAAAALPAIVVVRMANGFTHFVVAWRRHGRVVQVMDPATGRRWPSGQRFLDELYRHTHELPATVWRAWAETEEFLGALRQRWATLGIGGPEVEQALVAAVADPHWFPLATLDATTRMLAAIVRAGGLRRGWQATRLFITFAGRTAQEEPGEMQTIPAAYWTVRPAPPDPDGEVSLQLRGAVLLRVRGWQEGRPDRGTEATTAQYGAPAQLSPDLVAALEEPPSRPGRQCLHWLYADGLLAPGVLLLALLVAASSVVVEALLWRGLVDLSRDLGLVEQRLGALVVLLAFVGALLLLDLANAIGLWRLGRRLEARLRMAFLEKIPRLGDRYFQSRPTSDMAERSHSVHRLRLLPDLGGQVIRLVAELLLTTAGLIWLDPSHATLAILAAACTLGLPLAVHPLVTERDLRVRTHAGALGRFYLDALLGLTAVRTHGAERAMRREHESLLVEWGRAGLQLQRTVMVLEGFQALLGFGLAAALLFAYLAGGGEASGVLLLTYWALHLPMLGQELILLARQYPSVRNVTLRLLEPIGAREETPAPAPAEVPGAQEVPLPDGWRQGVVITLEDVSVRAAGHTILSHLELAIASGSHVAIVGASGAGKSSLVGLLLGWYRPATGRVLVDGCPLDDQRLARLRQETAWVDPAIQLWNRSLLDNLCYGTMGEHAPPVALALTQADLRSVLDRLPDGLQTPLGEGGGLVSGGEGQRVRFGRALMRPGVRLVILDEPFRGLDRARRRELLQRARQVWGTATLLCITHDVSTTHAFERVLVVDDGQIVEDGHPATLAASPGTRYRALLDAETAAHEGLWGSSIWRRLRLAGGQVSEAERIDTRPAGVPEVTISKGVNASVMHPISPDAPVLNGGTGLGDSSAWRNR